MKEIGVKRKDIQRAMGLKTEGAVRHYFCGRRTMNVEQIQVMARVLKWSVSQVLGEREPDSVNPAPGLDLRSGPHAGEPNPLGPPEPSLEREFAHCYPGAVVLSRDELEIVLKIYRPAPKSVKPMIKRLFAKVAKEMSRAQTAQTMI
jgi:hypothetical protein